MTNLTVRAFICVSVAMFIVSCTNVEGPRLGMKFEEPYSALFGGGIHAGLDLDVPRLTPVTSIGDRTVAQVLNQVINGQATNIVVIRHEGSYLSRYAHIDRITVKRGDEIKRGQQFAVVELNGPAGPNSNALVTYPHLHLEVIFKDRLIDPQSLAMTCGTGKWRWPVGCKN